jgi:hypothetical protein
VGCVDDGEVEEHGRKYYHDKKICQSAAITSEARDLLFTHLYKKQIPRSLRGLVMTTDYY